MIYLIIASVLLVVSYVGITIWGLKGLPDSISAMVYVLPRQGQWVWIVWMWVASLCVCIPLIGVMPDTLRFMGFITLACLMLCGAMPISSSTTNKKWHDWLGIAGGILSQVCVAFISPWWLTAWMLWPFLMGSTIIQPEGGDMRRLFKGKGVFVAEMICFLVLTGALVEYFLLNN